MVRSPLLRSEEAEAHPFNRGILDVQHEARPTGEEIRRQQMSPQPLGQVFDVGNGERLGTVGVRGGAVGEILMLGLEPREIAIGLVHRNEHNATPQQHGHENLQPRKNKHRVSTTFRLSLKRKFKHAVYSAEYRKCIEV